MRRIFVVLVISLASVVALPAEDAFATTTPGTFHALAPTRVTSTSVATHQTLSITVGGHGGVPTSGVAAVAITLSAVSPTSPGGLTAWQGGVRPATTTLRFAAKQSVTNGAVIPVSSTGKIGVYNSSAGSVTVAVDVDGYYTNGASSAAGAFHVLTPVRVVAPTTLSGGHTITEAIAGHGGVPSSNVGAVALNITITSTTHAGALLAFAHGAVAPGDAVVRFVTGQFAAAFAIVGVSAGGLIDIKNTATSGSVSVSVDVAGYFTAGESAIAGSTTALPLARAVSATIAAHGTLNVGLGGRGGVAFQGVAAAIVTLTAATPGGSGTLIAYRSGATRPSTTSLRFTSGRPSVTTALVATSTTSTIAIYNSASVSMQVIVDVSGYVHSATITAPATSVARYVRNISGVAGDVTTMHAEGQADAASGARLVLLDIGAQANDKSGVVLTDGAGTKISYSGLVTAVQAYLDGYGAVAGATVAVGTNNDANDWTAYPASQRGADWANRVIDMLHGGAGVAVVGADDIESEFFSTEVQAQQWETSYLASTSAALLYNGSATGCPTSFGGTATCSFGWTLAQYYALAHNGTRIRVLPQIYNPDLAVQWANVDRTGGGALVFAGSLTEHAIDATTLSPGAGWAALRNAIASVVAVPTIPAAVDIHVDG